jgi:membrane glycosyltransferase
MATTKASNPDWRKLNINLHWETMALLQEMADKRHTTVTETVRRATVVLAIVEGVDELENQALAVVTKNPKTGEVTEVREVLVVG